MFSIRGQGLSLFKAVFKLISEETCTEAQTINSAGIRIRSFQTSATSLCQQLTQEEQVFQQKERNKDSGSMIELIRDFLDPVLFFQTLHKNGIDFFCGVPDSLLKDFCAYVTTHVPKNKHVITANEGSAIAMAAGYHLATGKFGCVYLQNSGLGNTVNPLMSLASPSVYSIPMLLLIGWRGEPGKRDEPQHKFQGQATPGMLASMGIPFQPLPDYEEGAAQALQTARQYMETGKGPYGLLVKRQTFLPYILNKVPNDEFPLNRESALQAAVSVLGHKDVVVSTTGMLSRELFEYRVGLELGHEKDFLTVGSMGHASGIALGIALNRPKRQVFCLDGDGALIMHMGSMATIGQSECTNFKHIVINNGSHDSVGGQPTDAVNHDKFSFTQIAKGCGYKDAWVAITEDEVKDAVALMRNMDGPVLLEIKTVKGGRKDLGRPNRTPIENKNDFMHFLAIN